MMNRINNILIGLLWLLATTLGATFWFNTMYGFNIFSVQHWQHLAYMQATGQTIKTSFYVSLVVAVFIAVFVLYILLQPRLRKITLPIFDRSKPSETLRAPAAQAPATAPQQPASIPTPATQQPAPTAPTTNAIARPPHLNIPKITRAPAPRVPLATNPTPARNVAPDYTDIRDIFESAGYVHKGSPRIRGMQTATISIGTNEVLWIGAVGVTTSDMQRAVQTLSGVFTDTLDDIEIDIHPFIVAPIDNVENPDILRFDDVDALRQYIAHMPNTPPSDDDAENFDAYSGYIGTVVDYIGKI